MSVNSARDPRIAGLSLIEVLVASVLGLVVFYGVYAVLIAGTTTYGTEMVGTDLDRQACHALDRIAEEISMAGRSTLFPRSSAPLSAAGVGYQVSEGWSGSAMVWGPATLIAFDYDIDDPDDGVDNDGDGSIDEGLIVWRRNPGQPDEHRVVLARSVREYLEGEEPNGVDDNGNGLVDERGLAVSVNGEVWTIRLTLERHDANGQLLTRTLETSVTPRN